MSLPRDTSEVCTVFTTFRPDNCFPERVERARAQTGLVVIIDDSGNLENKNLLISWFQALPDVILSHNHKNLGIAAALNRGVSIAKRYGFQWILTLDDDSLINRNMVERLLFYLRQIDAGRPIGLIGMSWSSRDGSHPTPSDSNRLWQDKRGIITSGSFFSTASYEEIGPFREEFVIGSVDYDYCLRAREKGYRVVKINEIGFEHSLGSASVHRVFGRNIRVFNHEASRLYYSYRNLLVLAREQVRKDTAYTVAVITYMLRIFFLVLLFEQDKLRKISAMIRGSLDGSRNRLGMLRGTTAGDHPA